MHYSKLMLRTVEIAPDIHTISTSLSVHIKDFIYAANVLPCHLKFNSIHMCKWSILSGNYSPKKTYRERKLVEHYLTHYFIYLFLPLPYNMRVVILCQSIRRVLGFQFNTVCSDYIFSCLFSCDAWFTPNGLFNRPLCIFFLKFQDTFHSSLLKVM